MSMRGNELLDNFLFVQYVDVEHDDPLMLVLIGQSTHRRNLGDAGRAPGRPKIENYRMSSKAAKSHDISIQIPKRKIGRHRRNVRCGLARIACQTKDAQDKLDCQPSQLIHRDPLSGEERRVNGNRIYGMPSSFGGSFR
jgi:hypothetical protein